MNVKLAAFRRLAAAALCLLAGTEVTAGELGTSAGVFLRLARTAREAALGGATTGAVGASAVGRNPAALVGASGIVASRNNTAGGAISVDHASVARDIRRDWALGASFLHATSGGIDQVDDSGEKVGGFTPRDVAGTVAAARRRGAYEAGVSATYMRSTILHTAQALTGAAGLAWQAADGRTRLSLAAINVGGRLHYVDASEPLPRSVRMGAWRKLGRLNVVLEGVAPNDDDFYGIGGAEMILGHRPWSFALRGVFDGSRARSRTGAAGLAAGAGLSAGNWTLDYAWTPGGDIGDDQLITLGFRFTPSSASASTRPSLR